MPCPSYWRKNLHFGYTLKNLQLEAVPEDRDVGVVVDGKLKFDSHASMAASSANQTLGAIKRTISSCSPGVMTTLYETLVCPKHEVGMTLLFSFYKKTYSS